MQQEPKWIDDLSSEYEVDGVPWYKWREMDAQWREEHNLPPLKDYNRGIQADLKAKARSDWERKIPSIRRRYSRAG